MIFDQFVCGRIGNWFFVFYDADTFLKHHAIRIGHDFIIRSEDDNVKGFYVFNNTFTRHIFVVYSYVIPNSIWKCEKHDDATSDVAEDRPLCEKRNPDYGKNRGKNQSDIPEINTPDENQSQNNQSEYGDVDVFYDQCSPVF